MVTDAMPCHLHRLLSAAMERIKKEEGDEESGQKSMWRKTVDGEGGKLIIVHI